MAKPQKDSQPKKDADKAFLLKRVGQSFDLDDVPAAPEPARPDPSPVIPDFKPYRPNGKNDRIVELNDMDDDEDNTVFWGEDDEIEDDPLYDIANKLLPDRPEINVTINSIDHIDMTCLIAAGVIEEEMRGQMKDQLVDQLTAGALLVGSQNFDDVAGHLSHQTVSLVDAFMAASENGPLSETSFKSLDMQTQRLMIAMTAADLEVLHKGMQDHSVLPPYDYELEMVGNFIAIASRSTAAEPTQGDIRLLKRAASLFNDVSKSIPLDVQLVTGDKGFKLVEKNAAPQPESIKPKNPKPKGMPKPPHH